MDIIYTGPPSLKQMIARIYDQTREGYQREPVHFVVYKGTHVPESIARVLPSHGTTTHTQDELNEFIEVQLSLARPFRQKRSQRKKLSRDDQRKTGRIIQALYTTYSRSSVNDTSAHYNRETDHIHLDPFITSLYWLFGNTIPDLRGVVSKEELDLPGIIRHELVHHEFGDRDYSHAIRSLVLQTHNLARAYEEYLRLKDKGDEGYLEWNRIPEVQAYNAFLETLEQREEPYTFNDALLALHSQKKALNQRGEQLHLTLVEECIAYNLAPGEEAFRSYLANFEDMAIGEFVTLSHDDKKRALALFKKMGLALRQDGLSQTVARTKEAANQAFRENTSLLNMLS
ncbi:hypothetical protein J4410_02815 [Candidatus Woesearchaeota archaeon]|nr:hypothetical protein [Candidatus Woesearchaeota archaeon]